MISSNIYKKQTSKDYWGKYNLDSCNEILSVILRSITKIQFTNKQTMSKILLALYLGISS